MHIQERCSDTDSKSIEISPVQAIGPLEIRVDLLPPSSDCERSPLPPASDSDGSPLLPVQPLHHFAAGSEVTVVLDMAVDLESGVSGPQSSDKLSQSAHCNSSTQPPELLPIALGSANEQHVSRNSKLLGAEAETRQGAEADTRKGAEADTRISEACDPLVGLRLRRENSQRRSFSNRMPSTIQSARQPVTPEQSEDQTCLQPVLAVSSRY